MTYSRGYLVEPAAFVAEKNNHRIVLAVWLRLMTLKALKLERLLYGQ